MARTVSGRVTYNARAARIEVTFPFSYETKDRVKAIPGSAFDGANRLWHFPRDAAEVVVNALRPVGFIIDPALEPTLGPATDVAPRGLPEAATDDTRPAPAASGRAHDDPPRLRSALLQPASPDARPEYPSVASVMRTATAALAAAFAGGTWVVGTVQGLRRGRQGTTWLDLVDLDAAEQVSARLRVVLFGAHARTIEEQLDAAGFPLEDGLRLALFGELGAYASRAEIQLRATRVDVTWSQGELELRRRRVLAAIEAEGLTGRNRRHPLPLLPLRVALLTSANGDALHDVLETLRQHHIPLDVELHDVRVQGRDLETTVLRALDAIREAVAPPDLVMLTRGGGSQSELSGWDSVAIARALATLPVPALVAIGHERDSCALEAVAWSARTPTAAAQLLASSWQRQRDRVDAAEAQLRRVAERSTTTAHEALRGLARRFAAGARAGLAAERDRTTRELPLRLRAAAQRATGAHRARLDAAPAALRARALRRIREHRAAVEHAASRVSLQRIEALQVRQRARVDALERRLRSRAEDLLARTRQQLDACARHVRAVHPDRTLARGFAIVRLPGGAALRDAAEAPPDATLHITVDNAVVTARVVSSEPRHAAGAPPPATTDELLRQPARDASNEAPHETTHSTGHTTTHARPRERD